MSRVILITVVFALVFAAGCEEQLKDDARFRVDTAMEAKALSEGFAVPEASEVDFVEQMAARRNGYRESLEALVDYYSSAGNAMKGRWARRELDSLLRIPQYRYLMPGQTAYADLRATDSIEAADILFEEAMRLSQEAGGLLIIVDDGKLRTALNKFNLLINSYPNSDKIDDAAYRAGRIYEHFQDYEIAAVYYQRAFQWSETTPYPARYRAACVLDKHLHMRKEALALYQMSREKESRYKENTERAQKRIRRMTRPKTKPKSGPETSEQPPDA